MLSSFRGGLNLKMYFSTARQQLYQLVHASPNFDLATAALYIAQEEDPNLDVNEYLHVLDTMAEEVQERLPQPAYPLRMMQIINHYLFEELGFTGNTEDYYDPRNSFLNQVLERRTGIPITLSLVYLEIARRLDFPMVGVNFPGHFLIRPDREDMDIHIDPFHKGEILFDQDCQDRLAQIYGRPTPLDVRFLQAVTPRQLIVRLLTNLKHIYLSQRQVELCLAACERILLVDPDQTSELRDRGILYYHLDRWTEARQDLEDYLATNPSAEDKSLANQLLKRIDLGLSP